MAGNSGKMTNEAIRARGPRNVLARRRDNGGLFYYKEGQSITVEHGVIARSYSMSYLKKLEKTNG